MSGITSLHQILFSTSGSPHILKCPSSFLVHNSVQLDILIFIENDLNPSSLLRLSIWASLLLFRYFLRKCLLISGGYLIKEEG